MCQLFGDTSDTKEDLVEYRPVTKRQRTEAKTCEPTPSQTRAYSTRGVKISLAEILGIRESRKTRRSLVRQSKSSASAEGSSGRRSIGTGLVQNGKGRVYQKPISSDLVDSNGKQGSNNRHQRRISRAANNDGSSRKTSRVGKQILEARVNQRPKAQMDRDRADNEAVATTKRPSRKRRPNSKYN